MWLLGFELRTFGRAVGCSYPLSHLTSPAGPVYIASSRIAKAEEVLSQNKQTNKQTNTKEGGRGGGRGGRERRGGGGRGGRRGGRGGERGGGGGERGVGGEGGDGDGGGDVFKINRTNLKWIKMLQWKISG